MTQAATKASTRAMVSAAALLAVLTASGEALAQAREGVASGSLTCDVSAGVGLVFGSQRTMNCTFTPSNPAPIEYYQGTITKVGVDLGVTTAGVMVWGVVAPTSRPVGALAGSYGGVSGEATVIGGAGANVLFGGSNRTVTLQPLSVTGQVGFNVAGGVAGIDLRFVREVNPYAPPPGPPPERRRR